MWMFLENLDSEYDLNSDPFVSGLYDRTTVRDMLKECSKMEKINHLNVLTLVGVCLDGGPAPFIIMPFMANGSLLTYLRKNRETLVVFHENKDDEDVSTKTMPMLMNQMIVALLSVCTLSLYII